MNDRIKELRKMLDLSQEDFGEKIRFSRSHVSSLENGARELTDRVINDICREYNVSEDWIRYGTGEMFNQPDTFSLDEYAKKSKLTELEIAIMKGYMDLDRGVRETLLNHVEKLFSGRAETVATVEDDIDAEVESYRRELEDEKKGQILSVTQKQKETS